MAGSSRIKSANFRINISQNQLISEFFQMITILSFGDITAEFPIQQKITKKTHSNNTSVFCHKGIASGSFDSSARQFFRQLFQIYVSFFYNL